MLAKGRKEGRKGEGAAIKEGGPAVFLFEGAGGVLALPGLGDNRSKRAEVAEGVACTGESNMFLKTGLTC